MQGKILGGSIVCGVMFYYCGLKGVYKKWVEQVGDDVYIWDNWLLYFQKSVKFFGFNINLRFVNVIVVNNFFVFFEFGGLVYVVYFYWINVILFWVDKVFVKLGFFEV